MSAAYLKPDVPARRGHAHAARRFRDPQRYARETWRPSEGFGVGYHLFDADTGTLIVDGARVHPAHDVKPGETRAGCAWTIAAARRRRPLPGAALADARKRLLVLRAGLALPAGGERATADGARAVDRVRVATGARSARERARARHRARVRAIRSLTIWRNRGLIRVDGAARHPGPLSRRLRRRVLDHHQSAAADADLLLRLRRGAARPLRPATPAAPSFALYFLAGMLPWLAFSEAAGRAPGVMLEHRNFVKKLVFAVETLPVNLVVAGLVTRVVRARALLRLSAGDQSRRCRCAGRGCRCC